MKAVGTISLSPSACIELSAELAILSDPSRLLLLSLIGRNPHGTCVSDLAAMADLSVSTASHHLRKAKRAGLAKSQPAYKMVLYSLTDRGRHWVDLAEESA
ncbi:MAG: winged helix-turn-helix transcriptional regulator [Thermoleophilia bacterium]|nr:winged helix-turn-helix transcriptional regulator [Thermoleophilia bacterium]